MISAVVLGSGAACGDMYACFFVGRVGCVYETGPIVGRVWEQFPALSWPRCILSCGVCVCMCVCVCVVCVCVCVCGVF